MVVQCSIQEICDGEEMSVDCFDIQPLATVTKAYLDAHSDGNLSSSNVAFYVGLSHNRTK